MKATASRQATLQNKGEMQMKTRKWIVLLAIVMLLALSASSALAGCQRHENGYAYLSSTVATTSYSTDSQHITTTTNYYMCQICMLLDPWSTTTTVASNHGNSYVNDLGHVGSTKTHKYTGKCKPCTYTRPITYSCPAGPGGPHQLPF